MQGSQQQAEVNNLKSQ